MPTLRLPAGPKSNTAPSSTALSRTLLALMLAGATLAGATLFAVAQDRPRGGPLPADHPQTEAQRPSEQRQADQRQAPAGPGVLRLLPGDAVTQHTIEIAGGKLDLSLLGL